MKKLANELPLLLTKLNLPPLQPDYVPREKLRQYWEAVSLARLVLISAPAGSGKTSCLSEWCSLLSEQDTRIVWYSLDQTDNDPSRFSSYILKGFASLMHIDEKEEGFLCHSIELESDLIGLMNRLSCDPNRYLLVLDDYHFINEKSIHKALGTLLERLPHNLQLAIASRADPPLQLARLRARNQLVELRSKQLRFNSQEILEFFNAKLNLALSMKGAQTLENWAEGWIAGLQLLALSISQTAEPPSEEATLRLTEQVSGSQSYIFEYLAEEVFQQQPLELQTFLLETAVLEQLNPDLCEAVCEQPGAVKILHFLEKTNLFIIPLDQEHNWYRYHHLFRRFLYKSLEQTYPNKVKEIHQRALAWYSTKRLPDEAIQHALAAQEFEAITELVETFGDGLFTRNELVTLKSWLATLPPDISTTHPQLCLFQALTEVVSGNPELAENYLKVAENALKEGVGKTKFSRVSLEAEIAAIRTSILYHRGDLFNSIKMAELALSELPPEKFLVYNRTKIVLGSLYRLLGRFDEAKKLLEEAFLAGQVQGHLFISLKALSHLGLLEYNQGKLANASQYLQQALDQATRQGMPLLPITSLPYLILGQINFEWNNLQEAERLARRGLEIGLKGVSSDVVIWAYVLLAAIQITRGELNEANTTLEQALENARHNNLSIMVDSIQPWFARLWLQQGKRAQVESWLDDTLAKLSGEVKPDRYLEYVGILRVLLKCNRMEQALALIESLEKPKQAKQSSSFFIVLLLLKAWAQMGLVEEAKALATLEQALDLMVPENYTREFVDCGNTMFKLLNKYCTWLPGKHTQYVKQLLGEFDDLGITLTSTPDTYTDRTVAHLAKLTERELEVLQLVSKGATNREIAGELVLSLGTVKTHLTNLCNKLMARNRTEAVASARRLGLMKMHD